MIPTYKKSDQKIGYLLEKFRGPEFDDYTRSHIANYSCVLLCGLIETAVREIVAAHCEKKAAPMVSNYVKSQLEWFQNPDPQKIVNLLSSFDRSVAERLEGNWKGEIRDAIGSIVGNRHLIAHGRDTALTILRVLDWLKAARSFIDLLETEFR